METKIKVSQNSTKGSEATRIARAGFPDDLIKQYFTHLKRKHSFTSKSPDVAAKRKCYLSEKKACSVRAIAREDIIVRGKRRA